MGVNDSMSTSKSGLEFIAKWEGCVLKPYLDIAGLRTIGIGHLIKPNENFPDGVEISLEKAYELLASDVKKCEDSIRARIKVPLNQNQFDALVSFGFNCGTGVYAMSDACKTLNQGNYADVPEKLLAWSKARINGVLQINKGLYNRRKSEGELFSKLNELQSHTVQWTKQTLVEAQTKLTKLGLYKIKIDGVWGPSTSSAIQTFAEQRKLQLGNNPKIEIPIETYDELIKS